MVHAAEAYADAMARKLWQWWGRLQWAEQGIGAMAAMRRLQWARRGIGEMAAMRHLEAFEYRLRAESLGIRLLVGFHADPMPHAHLILKLSRRLRLELINAEEVRSWLALRWPHGPVWVEPFDNARLEREHRMGGGAARYLAAHPGGVVASAELWA